MRIRSCGPADLPVLLEIFYQSVHLACTGEYTPAQLDAWAPAEPDFASWGDSLRREIFLTAEENGSLLGFTALEEDYLDLLYVRPDYLRRGIASALCGALEHRCPETRIYVHASKTSRPFFEARGYRIVRPQQVERRGQVLTNFVMEKELIGWT